MYRYDEFDAAFGAPPAAFDLARVALDPPPADAYRASFTVRPQELDPMDHANNAVYADWLDEAIVRAGAEPAIRAVPRFVRLEYARSAERDDLVTAEAWPDAVGGAWSVRLSDEAGDLLRARLEPTDGA